MRLTLFFLFLSSALWAQNDTLIFKNKEKVIGEIKELNQGVLTIETNYSDSDFKIDWDHVEYISTKMHFLISASDGHRMSGYIHTLSNGKIQIRTIGNEVFNYKKSDIVFLDQIKNEFWSKVYASFDLGLNVTKANNYRQVSFNGDMGYLGKKWSVDLGYSDLNSVQDDVDPTARSSANFDLKYFLPRDYFLTGTLSTLQNTEQSLDFRLNSSLGFGKYLIHSNQAYWGFAIGTNSNRETYVSDTMPSYSWEGYVGTELNLFNLGDLNLLTKLNVYYTLEKDIRWRTDYSLTTKYDLPWDFYINLDLNMNFDSRPQEGGAKTDYVVTTGFGWKFD